MKVKEVFNNIFARRVQSKDEAKQRLKTAQEKLAGKKEELAKTEAEREKTRNKNI